MRKQLVGISALVLAACATSSAPMLEAAPFRPLAGVSQSTEDTLRAINAMCSSEARIGKRPPKDLKVGPGVGTGGFKVDTANADAQAWFDYGMALYHAFYHADAKVAMKKAAEADPTCAMCAWGEAMALGPTLNYGAVMLGAPLEAAQRAQKLVKAGDARAKRLVDAMVARYDGSKGSEKRFGEELAVIAKDYPNEPELTVLAAHSLMIPGRGDDKAVVDRALVMLEDVLKQRPDDTGAIHYYIHGTEFAGRAEDAVPYADKLGRLAPKASHLVHMPAHTFFHAGRYQDAALVNAAAVGADGEWTGEGTEKNEFIPTYYAHNVAFGLAGALMSGDAELALKYADHAERVWPKGSAEQGRRYPVPRAYVALARFAPDRALAIPAPTEKDASFANYRHYARGEALLTKGDVEGAKAEIKALDGVKASGDDRTERNIVRDVLKGRVAMAEGRTAEAAKLFEKVAKLQETQLSDYWDPPPWWYPVRRSVAAAHLKAGEFAKAEAEANASLATWKHDPLALWVLGKAQEGLGKSEAAGTLEQARKIWRGTFESITVDVV